jgi:hypothetical protein
MKTFVILLALIELIYHIMVKLAVFMVSLLSIVIACLFIRNMVRNSIDLSQPGRNGAQR